MIRRLAEFTGFDLETTDGRRGRLRTLCLDAKEWRVRGAIAEFPGRRPLSLRRLPLEHIVAIDDDSQSIPLSIASEKLQPITPPTTDDATPPLFCGPDERNSTDLIGVDVHGADAFTGIVVDLACDVQTWAVRYLLVRTSSWVPGRTFLLSTEWIEALDWTAGHLATSIGREELARQPDYDPDLPILAGDDGSAVARQRRNCEHR